MIAKVRRRATASAKLSGISGIPCGGGLLPAATAALEWKSDFM